MQLLQTETSLSPSTITAMCCRVSLSLPFWHGENPCSNFQASKDELHTKGNSSPKAVEAAQPAMAIYTVKGKKTMSLENPKQPKDSQSETY